MFLVVVLLTYRFKVRAYALGKPLLRAKGYRATPSPGVGDLHARYNSRSPLPARYSLRSCFPAHHPQNTDSTTTVILGCIGGNNPKRHGSGITPTPPPVDRRYLCDGRMEWLGYGFFLWVFYFSLRIFYILIFS